MIPYVCAYATKTIKHSVSKKENTTVRFGTIFVSLNLTLLTIGRIDASTAVIRIGKGT